MLHIFIAIVFWAFCRTKMVVRCSSFAKDNLSNNVVPGINPCNIVNNTSNHFLISFWSNSGVTYGSLHGKENRNLIRLLNLGIRFCFLATAF
jgi:hypothetical protein